MSTASAFQTVLQDILASFKRFAIKSNPGTSAMTTAEVKTSAEDIATLVAMLNGANPFGAGGIVPVGLSLTGNVASLGVFGTPVPWFTTPNDGVNHLYRLSTSLVCSVAGGGNAQQALYFINEVSQLVNEGPAVVNFGLGQYNTYTSLIAVKANTSIGYTVAYTGPGTYSVYLTAELVF